MTENKVVARATLQELGTSLSQGLQFLGGDIEKTLDVVIAQNADKVVTMESAKVEIVADPENNVEQQDAVAAVELVVGDETRQEILGAIAGLPQLRGLFTESIAISTFSSDGLMRSQISNTRRSNEYP